MFSLLCTIENRDISSAMLDLGHEIELNVFPFDLKYVFLGEKNTYPVIISKELTKEQEVRRGKEQDSTTKAPQSYLEGSCQGKEVLKLKDPGIIYSILHRT
ncbi:uncharacterized protein E6C27_scaffold437G00730 [Cucumis melo var. makuwa]|uniref:Uncharacterized protein n=1 Tax=Cucumis melo var. makuwa TaxID=1194695 RepID=A0A5A7UIL1_CUCMM|nr:uncharacterized protein E6C27_scaffold437G00730 [Cucumis melo var. makuwa]